MALCLENNLRECLSLCVRDAQRDMLHSELLGNFSRLAPQGQRRPRRVRVPTWTPELAEYLLPLRRQYPRWGKEKFGSGKKSACRPPWWDASWWT